MWRHSGSAVPRTWFVLTNAGLLIYCKSRRLSLCSVQSRDFFVQILNQTQLTLCVQDFFFFNPGQFFFKRLEVCSIFIYWLHYFTNILSILTKSNSFSGWRLWASLISELGILPDKSLNWEQKHIYRLGNDVCLQSQRHQGLYIPNRI